jgi:two-component system chemotaxis response regulator CheB
MAPQCITIGASAGGFEVLQDIAAHLPADFPVPVFVVLHIAPYEPSLLPKILNRVGPLHAIHPEDGQRFEPGFIYVAPPDHHLLVDAGHIAVKRGPKENNFRPSIDTLFRSAAYSFGPRTIGVVLSGALSDGTSGLWSIKRLGGIAVVQDPFEARFPSMPRSALEYIEADYTVRSTEIAPLLTRLVQNRSEDQRISIGKDVDEDIKRMAKEIQIAAGISLPEKTVLDLGELSPFTCPECRGVLVRIQEGNLFRFRCHTGHSFTADALLEEIMRTIGDLIWQVQRGFQEGSMLLEHIGTHMQERGEMAKARVFLAKALELNQRATAFQKLAIGHESLSEESLEQHQPDTSEADD